MNPLRSAGENAAKIGAEAVHEATQTVEESIGVIAAKVDEVTGLFRDSLVPAFADGISQVLQNFSRLDDAIVDVGPISITVTIPAFNVRLRAPMKPKGTE